MIAYALVDGSCDADVFLCNLMWGVDVDVIWWYHSVDVDVIRWYHSVDVDVRHNTWKVSRPDQAPPASHLGLGDHMPGKL